MSRAATKSDSSATPAIARHPSTTITSRTGGCWWVVWFYGRLLPRANACEHANGSGLCVGTMMLRALFSSALARRRRLYIFQHPPPYPIFASVGQSPQGRFKRNTIFTQCNEEFTMGILTNIVYNDADEESPYSWCQMGCTKLMMEIKPPL